MSGATSSHQGGDEDRHAERDVERHARLRQGGRDHVAVPAEVPEVPDPVRGQRHGQVAAAATATATDARSTPVRNRATAASSPTALGQRWTSGRAGTRWCVWTCPDRDAATYPRGYLLVSWSGFLRNLSGRTAAAVPSGHGPRRRGRRLRRRRAARHRLRHHDAGDRHPLLTEQFGARPAGYDVRLLTPGGRPVTARPGLRLEAHGALERRHRPGRHPRRRRRPRAPARGAATRCSSPTSGGWPATRAGWRRCARAPPCWRRRACSTGAGPPRTGPTPTASPATTRRSPSTPIRSSCGTAASRRRRASPARWTSRCRSSRRTTAPTSRAGWPARSSPTCSGRARRHR